MTRVMDLVTGFILAVGLFGFSVAYWAVNSPMPAAEGPFRHREVCVCREVRK